MIERFTIRRMDIGANLALAGLAVVLMVIGYRLGAGWGSSGPRPGFFPFSVALVMGLGALAALVKAWRSGRDAPFFERREELVDLLKAGVPAALAIATIPFLGLYLTATAYLMVFTWWQGGFRWYTALATALACVGVLYLILDWAFRIPMPKSPFYGRYFLI